MHDSEASSSLAAGRARSTVCDEDPFRSAAEQRIAHCDPLPAPFLATALSNPRGCRCGQSIRHGRRPAAVGLDRQIAARIYRHPAAVVADLIDKQVLQRPE